MNLLPVVAHIAAYGGETKDAVAQNVRDYLAHVAFPHGISKDTDIRGKSYIPISRLERDMPRDREKLESSFQELVYKSTGAVEGTINAILVPITELVMNIFDHSGQSHGWLFAQNYPKKRLLDICICDTGRGYAASYREELGEVLDDKDAIEKALEGVSVKPEKGRGWGLYHSSEIVCAGLGGKFAVISGAGLYYRDRQGKRLVTLPHVTWNGVVIGYQIPHPTGPIDITRYLG